MFSSLQPRLRALKLKIVNLNATRLITNFSLVKFERYFFFFIIT